MPLVGFEQQRLVEGRAPEAAERARSSRRHPVDAAARMLDGIGGLGWSVIGFIVGAVFWHFIGFWSFMADVVLAGGPPEVTEPPAISQPLSGAVAESRHVVALAACTVLTRDRRSGATRARPCDAGFPSLPADGFQGREDRVAAAPRFDRR